MKPLRGILIAVVAFFALASCHNKEHNSVPDSAPSVYYWRTTLKLDSVERAFLTDHHISKVYLRLFDIVVRDGKCVPSADISFNDTLPDSLRIIPTIFITEECLHADTAGLAAHIVERVRKMCTTHDLPNVSELQLDCDWTPSSREAYFALLDRVRLLLHEQAPINTIGTSETPSEGWKLSVTIRLHQLSQPAPPSDYGVLMLYNTGDMRKRDCRNPIFATEDIEPYLKNLKSYQLPLCAAYPNYRWQRLFAKDEFKALLYSENLKDSTVYERLDGDSLYRVIQGRTLHGVLKGDYDVQISPGDEVVVSIANMDEMQNLARRLEEARPGLHSQVIFYHLDHESINNYNDKYYEAIYRIR